MRLTRLGVLGFALAMALGCDARLATVPVSGTVTLDGRPVDGAMVAFHNRDLAGKPAMGTTDAQGKFTLATFVGGKDDVLGALPGEYDVAITKLDTEAVDGSGFPRPLLPAKYGKLDSGLEAIVKKGGAGNFDFKLSTF